MARNSVKRSEPQVGDRFKFKVAYPIFHVEQGAIAKVESLLGTTHVNMKLNIKGVPTVIAMPLVDLEPLDNASPTTSILEDNQE